MKSLTFQGDGDTWHFPGLLEEAGFSPRMFSGNTSHIFLDSQGLLGNGPNRGRHPIMPSYEKGKDCSSCHGEENEEGEGRAARERVKRLREQPGCVCLL